MSLNNLISQLYSNIALGQKLDSIVPFVKYYQYDDWKKYINFSQEKYTRNLVYRSDLFDIYVICWNNNQHSPIHDHSQNGCVMKILQGSLIQQLYSKDVKFIEKMIIRENQVTYIDNDIGFHKIMNTNQKTVSLHIYSPACHKTVIYTENLNTPTI